MRIIGYTTIFALFLVAVALSQSRIESLEYRLESINAKLDSLKLIEVKNSVQIDSIAARISTLKSQKNLSFFERRQLENLLKESQSLLQQQQNLQAEISGQSNQRELLKTTLIKVYSLAIDSLVAHAEQQSAHLTKHQRADLLYQAQVLTVKRAELVVQKPSQLRSSQAATLTISADDTPREIEEKADYLNDQEEKLRQQAAALSKKVKELENESKLRLRMSELVDDLRLFDQREEPMNPSQVANALTKSETMGKTYWSNRYLNVISDEGIARSNAAGSPFPVSQLLSLEFSNIDPKDFDEVIFMLETQCQALMNQADSLAILAKNYREQARLLRTRK